MNLNQVLFATDFSDGDLEAFKSSCKLALDWNAKLHIVHVEDPRESVKPANRRTSPERELVRFIPENFGIDYSQEVLVGDAAEEILCFADKIGATLIVLGTHGRDGMRRFFSGSVAEEIMRKAKCPVMTQRAAHAAAADRKRERILVPTDFSVHGYAALDFAGHMALTTSAELTICYVDDSDSGEARHFESGRPEWTKKQDELWNQLREFKPKSPKISFTHKLFSGDPGEQICNYANSKSYDFIVIGTHGRTGLTRAIMGSVAEYVVRHSNCPVVSVKPSNKRAHLFV